MAEDSKSESSYDIDYGDCDISFNIIVVGDQSVGKGSLTIKAIKDYFEDFYSPTIGFEFFFFIQLFLFIYNNKFILTLNNKLNKYLEYVYMYINFYNFYNMLII